MGPKDVKFLHVLKQQLDRWGTPVITQPLVFSKRKWLAGQSAPAGWPSVDLKLLQHGVPRLGQTGRDKEETGGYLWACLLEQKFWSSPHWSFGAWGAGVTTRATNEQARANTDTSSDPKQLSTVSQQVVALQLLTTRILCPIEEQDLRVGLSWHILLCSWGRLEVFVQLGWDVLSQHVMFTQFLTVR